MGDERRVDTTKAKRATDDAAKTPSPDHGQTFTEDFGPEHRFTGVGDTTLLAKEIDDILAGRGDASTLVAKVANADFTERQTIASRLADVARVAAGNDLLAIADLVGMRAIPKIRSALAAKVPPAGGVLRAHIFELPPAELFALLDAPTLAALKKNYSSPSSVLPQVDEMGRGVTTHPELVAWYVTASPPADVAMSMMRMEMRSEDWIVEISAVLETIGPSAWDWGLAVTEPIAGRSLWDAAGVYAAHCTRADVRQHLQSFAKPTAGFVSGKAPLHAGELEKLVSAGAIDVAAVIDAVYAVRAFAKNDLQVLTKAPYRQRLIAASTFQELELLTGTLIPYEPAQRLDWLVESAGATPERIRSVTARWDDSWIESSTDPARLGRLMTRFPDASPADLFGTHSRTLMTRALTNATVRRWFTRAPEPRTLLHLITQDVGHVTAMWNAVIGDGVPATWVHGLGAGNTDDTDLRMLALNCPDASAAAWIRERILGDEIATEHASSKGVAVDAIAFEGDTRKRFDKGLADDDVADLGERTSELSDDELAKLRADPDRLAHTLQRLSDKWVVRTVLRIAPPLPIVLANVSPDTAGLVAYIRTRPGAELVAAFADATTARRIEQSVRDPFVRFPQLTDPHVLAAVATSPSAIEWILKWTDAPYAIEMLGREVVAAAAGPHLTPDNIELVPRMVLSNERRDALIRLAKHARTHAIGRALRDRVVDPDDDRDADDATTKPATPEKATRGSFEPRDVQLRHDELAAALEHHDLAGALDVVLTPPANVTNVLAVCRERAAGAGELLTKPEHEKRVARLDLTVSDSPLGVFPSTPYYAFLHTPTSRSWLFSQESPLDLLREIASDAALAKLAFAKGTDPSVRIWFDRLPRGNALGAAERKLVRQLFDHAPSDRVAEFLFGVRFGPAIDTTFTKDELTRFWTLLERVPDAHVDQGSIKHMFQAKDVGYAGVFGGGNYGLQQGIFEGTRDTEMFDQKLELTHAQLIAAYGYNDAQLDALIKSGDIKVAETRAGKRYAIQATPPKLLENTVLHEIGHAVDEMLGSHTELVFSLAGWKQYGEADFDELATALGGWDRVSAADRQRIRDAWIVWLNASTGLVTTGLEPYVPPDHPALADRYRGVGIVDLGRARQPLGYQLPPRDGHYVSVNHKYQRFYRVPERTRDAGPSNYGMTAPQEFFAECYAEYYREYTGPGTESNKGGRLAGWIKTWFDANVDTLKYNPSRKDR